MYSITMALVDFIPVTLFGAAALILQRDLYNKASRGAYAIFCTGTIDAFMAGTLKALYKLLYAAGICDFQALSKMFFPVQALGFLLAGIGMMCITCRQSKQKAYGIAAAPAVYSGTFIFVALMVLGFGCTAAGLSVFAKKMKKPAALALFVISFIFFLMMGYLSSKDFTKSYMNWMAEIVNIFGELALLSGVGILHKAGLEQFQFCNQ